MYTDSLNGSTDAVACRVSCSQIICSFRYADVRLIGQIKLKAKSET